MQCPRAICGMIVVAAALLSQVMINSSDGFKAFAFFLTVRRQKELTGPVMSSVYLVMRLQSP
jgi:hypothetical protein